MAHNLIYYQFSRSQVERRDFSHFLSVFGPDRLPEGTSLREMMNRLVFCIEGWDDDPREIHLIPEIRRFYSAFHAAWPYWLYFCNLDVETLRPMTACCLRSVNTIELDGADKLAATFDMKELANFLGDDFLRMNEMCERAGVSEHGIYDRTKAVFTFFSIPFDAPPPTSEERPGRQKVGRNDPCPCGSGEKFKKCCGRG